MPAANEHRLSRLTIALSTAVIGAAFVAAGCGGTGDSPPRSIGAATASVSPTPSASSPSPSPSAVPSPTAVQVVVIPSAKLTPPVVKKPAPKPSTKPPTTKPKPKPSATHTHSGFVVPGAYCPDSEHGWYGYSSAGNRYRCSVYSNGQWRWKRV